MLHRPFINPLHGRCLFHNALVDIIHRRGNSVGLLAETVDLHLVRFRHLLNIGDPLVDEFKACSNVGANFFDALLQFHNTASRFVVFISQPTVTPFNAFVISFERPYYSI